MSTSIEEAIHSLKPNAEWNVIGDKVEWLDSKQTAPTDSEIAAERSRLDTAYTNNEYQRKRAAEYPSVVDQLDDIYHNGIDGWKATIKATKDKYPKS